jgi:hypothetical protein
MTIIYYGGNELVEHITASRVDAEEAANDWMLVKNVFGVKLEEK